MKEVMNPTKTSQETVKTDPELTKELANEAISSEVKEGIDVKANIEMGEEKSLADIKAEMEIYRANIKQGETKNERGQYDENLVLENEAKLRAAEKEIARIEMEEKKAQKISELQGEIDNYRQLITTAEKRNDEKAVLENEAKLREVEQQILNIKKFGLEPEIKSYENGEPVFVEADPDLPIETRLSETPDGLEEWQIQKTANPEILKINRGFGWGEINKNRLDRMMAEMPVHQNTEEEIAKIREELKTEEAPLEEETKTAEEPNVETNKNWTSEHFKDFEEETEEAPKPVETPKPEKTKKSFWAGLRNIWGKK